MDHPELLLILARKRHDDILRQRRKVWVAPTPQAPPLRVSLARYLRQLTDRLETLAVEARRVDA